MASQQFKSWLSNELDSRGSDSSVFVDYIVGILESEEEEDWKEALVEILNESLEKNDNCSSLCNEIVSKWNENKTNIEEERNEGGCSENVNEADNQIKNIIAMQQMTISKQTSSKVSNSDNDLSLAAAYAQLSDDEELYCDDNDRSTTSISKKLSQIGIAKNLNASSVDEEIRRKREQSKKISDEKKLTDKLNRENQKKKKQDRQEKEKLRTQKGERRK